MILLEGSYCCFCFELRIIIILFLTLLFLFLFYVSLYPLMSLYLVFIFFALFFSLPLLREGLKRVWKEHRKTRRE